MPLLFGLLLGLGAPASAAWIANPEANPACTTISRKDQLTVAADGAGGMFLVWVDYRNSASSGADLYGQHLNAEGVPLWPLEGLAICTANGPQHSPHIAADGSGGVYVIWTDERFTGFATDVFAQHLDSAGGVVSGWEAGGKAIRVTDQNVLPQVVSDGAGGAIFLWLGAVLNTNFGVYGLRVGANGSPAAGWSVEGNVVCPPINNPDFTGDIRHLTAVPDGQGGALAAFRRVTTGTGLDIFATRVQGSGALAPGWDVSGTTVCVEVNVQDYPRIVGGGAGDAYVAWVDGRVGAIGGYDMYVQRLTATGDVPSGWPANGKAVCTGTTVHDLVPQITTDGAGGAIVAWIDGRNSFSTAPGVFAARVLATGALALGWAPNGTLAATSHRSSMRDLSAVPDGFGGVFLSWSDTSNVPLDVWIQRLTGSGAIAGGYPADGRPVHTRALFNNQIVGAWTPQVVSDTPGRALVGWIDAREDAEFTGNRLQVYANRVLLGSYLSPYQRVQVVGSGGYQELFYNYDTGQLWVSPYQAASGPTYYSAPKEEWLGIFHYDYAAAAFTQGVYRVVDAY